MCECKGTSERPFLIVFVEKMFGQKNTATVCGKSNQLKAPARSGFCHAADISIKHLLSGINIAWVNH